MNVPLVDYSHEPCVVPWDPNVYSKHGTNWNYLWGDPWNCYKYPCYYCTRATSPLHPVLNLGRMLYLPPVCKGCYKQLVRKNKREKQATK